MQSVSDFVCQTNGTHVVNLLMGTAHGGAMEDFTLGQHATQDQQDSCDLENWDAWAEHEAKCMAKSFNEPEPLVGSIIYLEANGQSEQSLQAHLLGC